jgi:hypothetical protein
MIPLMAQANCSRCNGDLDTTGYPLWCKSCRAAHKREYEATKKEMQESRGFAAGQNAMRHYLAQQFDRYGSQGSFTGMEIARIILQSRGPA